LGVAHGISVKLGLWTFHKRRLTNFDFIDFWLPYLLRFPIQMGNNVILTRVFGFCHDSPLLG